MKHFCHTSLVPAWYRPSKSGDCHHLLEPPPGSLGCTVLHPLPGLAPPPNDHRLPEERIPAQTEQGLVTLRLKWRRWWFCGSKVYSQKSEPQPSDDQCEGWRSSPQGICCGQRRFHTSLPPLTFDAGSTGHAWLSQSPERAGSPP